MIHERRDAMVESTRELVQGAMLLLVCGCAESRSPAETTGGDAGFGGAAGAPSRGGGRQNDSGPESIPVPSAIT
jgi:hypothetical protein